MSIACVTNIVGDITLIDGFKMGAAGAAIATVAAQAVSVVLSLILIKKKGLPFHFAKKHLAFHKKTATNIIRLGSPIALQDMCNEVSSSTALTVPHVPPSTGFGSLPILRSMIRVLGG